MNKVIVQLGLVNIFAFSTMTSSCHFVRRILNWPAHHKEQVFEEKAGQPPNSQLFQSQNERETLCGESGKTAAVLTTRKVINQADNQYLLYRLSMQDCKNQQIPIIVNRIAIEFMDVSSEENPAPKSIPYQITEDREPHRVLQSGVLSLIEGKDILGREQPKAIHYQSNPIDFQALGTVYSLLFSVNLSKITLHESSREDSLKQGSTESITSRLRLGDSMFTQQDVTFENP